MKERKNHKWRSAELSGDDDLTSTPPLLYRSKRRASLLSSPDVRR